MHIFPPFCCESFSSNLEEGFAEINEVDFVKICDGEVFVPAISNSVAIAKKTRANHCRILLDLNRVDPSLGYGHTHIFSMFHPVPPPISTQIFGFLSLL